jgi:1,4-dihydroxy-6-naphthoate synthase
LLNSGSALGDGCGPLLIKRPETVLNSNSSIAIPGELTTANLLLKIAYPSFINKTSVLFSEIEDLVCSGKFDAGLIIHENRFTFQKKGLVKVEDLGDFWFNKTNLPIPLGGIAVSRNFSEQEQKKIDHLILKSLKFSLKNKESTSKYVKAHAQEMDTKVIQSHINLYVNDFSIDLGVSGRNAIIKVFEELHLDSNNIFV